MEHTSPNVSPRRRAISGRRLSFAHGFIEIASFNFPLPPSKQIQTDPALCDSKPDFSGFSWKQPRLASPNHCLPLSPRTALPENRIAEALSDTTSAS